LFDVTGNAGYQRFLLGRLFWLVGPVDLKDGMLPERAIGYQMAFAGNGKGRGSGRGLGRVFILSGFGGQPRRGRYLVERYIWRSDLLGGTATQHNGRNGRYDFIHKAMSVCILR
jgi:hypothetical protein